MVINTQASEQLLQVNAHLKEWNANLALEKATRYALNGRHQYERKSLALEEVALVQRAQLVLQQQEEIHQLSYQNSLVRLAIEERHLQEKTHLKQQLDNKNYHVYGSN